MLKEWQKWSPVKFEILAARIKTDFRCKSCVHVEVLEKLFKDMSVKYVFKEISILRKERKPSCFWCSWNRRKTLFQTAESLGCNKVALGHHKDDIIETTLLNLFFQGEFSTMNPRQEMFKGKIVIIRPLCYVEEKMTKRFATENNFPEQLCRCPYAPPPPDPHLRTRIGSGFRKWFCFRTRIGSGFCYFSGINISC